MKYNEKLYKYSGARFYEHYILPTNWSSRNPIIKGLWSFVPRDNSLSLEEFFDERLAFAEVVAVGHTCSFLVGCVLGRQTVQKELGDMACFVCLNLLVHIYPVAVQYNIRSRIKKVLEHRELKNRKGSFVVTQDDKLSYN